MTNKNLNTGTKPSESKNSKILLGYTAGFVLSVLLTLAAYTIAQDKLFTGWAGVYAILILAVAQLVVQARFFLHLGDKGSKLNIMTFGFMIIVVVILVVGSLWIMKHLDYNMMPHHQEEYMLDQYDKGGF